MRPDRKRKRSPSPLFVKDDRNIDTPDTNNKERRTFKTDGDDSVSCHPRCGYPVNSPLHQHRPWCHSSVPLAEATVLDIGDKFLAQTQKHRKGVSDSVMEKCRAISASKDLKVLYPPPKPTAIVGVTGAGKSQLVNALLGLPGVATTSSSSRGTYTTLEFQARRDTQRHRFVLEVILQKPEQIKTQLRDHLHAIHTYLVLQAQDPDADEAPEDEEITEQLKKYDYVYEILYTTLCGTTLMLTTEGGIQEHTVEELSDFEEFLNATLDANTDFKDLDLDNIITMLHSGIMELMSAQDVSDDVKVCAVDDLDALEKAMHETIQPTSIEEGARHLWPLVRKAVLYCEGIKLLDMGVSISDTAGFADTNEFVVNNTLTYLADAGTILLVAPVGRIAEREELNTQLSRSITMGKANSTYIVATHADRLDSVLKPSQRKKLSAEVQQRISSAEAWLQELELESQRLKGEKQRLMDAEQWKQHAKFDDDPADLQARKAKATREKERAIRQIQRTKIEQDLKNRLRKLTRSGHGPDLKVLFAATEGLEEEHWEQSICEDQLIDTGIPQIAQLLFEKPAREGFNLLWRTCTHRLPSDFQAIINLLTKSPGQMHQDVRARIVSAFDIGIERVASALYAELTSRFLEYLAEAFTEASKKEWASKANTLIDKWKGWHVRTVHAFCRKNGYWRLPDSKAISWTGNIQNVFATKVARTFDQMNSAVESIRVNLANSVDDFILLPLKKGTSNSSLGEESKPLTRFITSQIDDLSTDLKHIFDKLKDTLANVNVRATFHYPKSFIHQELEPAYQKAAGLCQKKYRPIAKRDNKFAKGATAHADRILILREKVLEDGPDNLFERVQTRTEAALEKVSKICVRKVKERLQNMKAAVLEDFDSKYKNEEQAAEVDPKARQAVHDAAVVAKRRLEKEVLPLLKECKTLDDRAAKEAGES